MMESYVVGFLFSEDLQRVALIRKNKPAWQAGRINDIGGKIEPSETADQAMHREFLEETGVNESDWQPFLTLRDNQLRWSLRFYRAFGDLSKVRSATDEEVIVVPAYPLPDMVIDNLRWIVPLATYALHCDVNEVEVVEEWAT
jgi:8-oxo-dGTP diphosphatase